jgi:hypothetical protein
MERKPGPLECKQKLEDTLARATRTLQDLLTTQLQRLQGEYEAIRLAHFPCVPAAPNACVSAVSPLTPHARPHQRPAGTGC